MLYCPAKYRTHLPNLNEEFKRLKGELPEKQARITLIQFLRQNLGLTVFLLTGITLAPYQELTLKAFFNRQFNLCVWSRGAAKTFIASIYCFLRCIFEPGSKILIAGPTFRTSRFIFMELDKIVNSKNAQLLLQCFGKQSKRSDVFDWQINDGSIRAIPLNGEKMRGFRATDLIIDEFLRMSEQVVNDVLKPFLVVPTNVAEQLATGERETKLIKEGKMKEEDRTAFEGTARMIALSSASYTFEHLYKVYEDWRTKIYDERENGPAKYFISQLSWKAIPRGLLDPSIIEEIQNTSEASAAREFGAQFTDESDSYFNAKKMKECTVPDTERPTTLIKGKRGGKYLLAIDPDLGGSTCGDFFAMALIELDQENHRGYLVHNYAVAGGNVKDHFAYLFYIMTNFDVVMVIIDHAGAQFLESAAESDLFQKSKVKLNWMECDLELEGVEYSEMLKSAQKSYNLEGGKICFRQFFSCSFIRRSNEHLQTWIDCKKIWFASKLTSHPTDYEAMVGPETPIIPVKLTGYPNVGELISAQDDLIVQTKKQCALIEPSVSPQGNMRFLLPIALQKGRSSNPDRARRDNYTALLLGCWAVRFYYDLTEYKPAEVNSTFEPFFI